MHIYLDGQATGIPFHIQEKSVTNLEQRRKGDAIAYSFKVSDLTHWEGFSLPVVLVVWDIYAREGRWVIVEDAIAALDRGRVRWRTQSTVRVQIPWAHTTDDNGLKRLKQAVGQRVYPLIAAGKDLQMRMTLTFPATQEGQEAQQAFERHIKEGEPVTLRGRTIESLEFSDWWERWFGGYDPDNVELDLGSPGSTQARPVSVTVVSNGGESAHIYGIELRVVQAGTEFARLSNEHQMSPLVMRLSVRKLDSGFQGSVGFSLNSMGGNVRETHTVLGFLNTVAGGGKLRIDFLGADNQSLSMVVEPQLNAAPDARFLNLVTKLSSIQEKTSVFFRVPEEGIDPKDALVIDELTEILDRGKTTVGGKTVIIEVKGEALGILLDVHRQGKPVHFRLTTLDSFVEIFQIVVSTGPMTREVTGYVEMSVNELESAIQNLSPDSFLPVRIINAKVIESFPSHGGQA